MLEYTHEQLLTDETPAGLTPRLASLVARCEETARQCIEAVDDGLDAFDEGGLRFAVVTETADLQPGGGLAAFLEVSGDPLAAVLDRLEGSHPLPDLQAHLLLLSISDTSGDYLIIPDECVNAAWEEVLDDLHPADETPACVPA